MQSDAMTEFPIAPLADSIAAGEVYLSDTPALQSHAGTQPDLFLRWNRIPLSSASIDVVVHLHGFSQQGRDMTLAEKVARSGLDLSLRVRPTLAMLPRGNWIKHYYYDFPAHRPADRLRHPVSRRYSCCSSAGCIRDGSLHPERSFRGWHAGS